MYTSEEGREGAGDQGAGKRAGRGRGGEALRAWALRAGRTSPPRVAARHRVPVLHVRRSMPVAAGGDVPGVATAAGAERLLLCYLRSRERQAVKCACNLCNVQDLQEICCAGHPVQSAPL